MTIVGLDAAKVWHHAARGSVTRTSFGDVGRILCACVRLLCVFVCRQICGVVVSRFGLLIALIHDTECILYSPMAFLRSIQGVVPERIVTLKARNRLVADR